MKMPPWDQQIARILVRPFGNTFVRPNHITALTLIMAVISGILFSQNDTDLAHWAAGIFVASRFLDHFDGELARIQDSASKFGYYFDYAAGGLGYTALFLGLGIGYSHGGLEGWSIVLGVAGAAAALISLFANLRIDSKFEGAETGNAIGYPGFAGFELEDGIYLLAPVTWLGYLLPFFIVAGIGSLVYCAWTMVCLLRPGTEGNSQ